MVLVAHFLGGKKYLFEEASLTVHEVTKSGIGLSEEHFSLSLPSLQGEYSWSPSCNLEEVKGLPSCLCRPHFLYADMDFLSNEASLSSGVHFLL